eukprot:m.262523 g.262523  ORF g.262523 m.262523 type:complete len:89 (-) comp15594_c0_seq1:4170-4436(-)
MMDCLHACAFVTQILDQPSTHCMLAWQSVPSVHHPPIYFPSCHGKAPAMRFRTPRIPTPNRALHVMAVTNGIVGPPTAPRTRPSCLQI